MLQTRRLCLAGVEENLKWAAFLERGIGTNRNLLTASITPELWLHLLPSNGSCKLQETEILIAKRNHKVFKLLAKKKRAFPN